MLQNIYFHQLIYFFHILYIPTKSRMLETFEIDKGRFSMDLMIFSISFHARLINYTQTNLFSLLLHCYNTTIKDKHKKIHTFAKVDDSCERPPITLYNHLAPHTATNLNWLKLRCDPILTTDGSFWSSYSETTETEIVLWLYSHTQKIGPVKKCTFVPHIISSHPME